MRAMSTAKPPTILVIDDDAEIRYSLTRVLSSRKYHVTEAASGEAGIALVKKEAPDLIFLDIPIIHLIHVDREWASTEVQVPVAPSSRPRV